MVVPAILPAEDQMPVEDKVIDEMLTHVPARNRKNVRYIMNKIKESKGTATWNGKGAFILQGSVVRGSHMLDLLKSTTAAHKVADDRRLPLPGGVSFLRPWQSSTFASRVYPTISFVNRFTL